MPWLVARGIDRGLPPIMAGGSARTLLRDRRRHARRRGRCSRSAGSASCASPAGSGRTCCWSCGAGCSRTSSGSTCAFHDRYTSGRVTSRLTSDIDAITELLAGGFDGLVTAVLTMVGVGVLMLEPRPQARRWSACSCFPLLVLLVRWFARTLGGRLPQGARGVGPGHRAVRRDDDRYPRGAGVPAGAAQRRDLREICRPLPGREHDVVPAGRDLHAGGPADRQRDHRRRAALRRPAGTRGRPDRSGC